MITWHVPVKLCYNMMYKLDKFRLWHITTNLFDFSWKCDKIVYKATRTLIKTLHTIYKNQLIFSKVITVNILTLKNRKIRNILNSQLEKTDVNLHSDIQCRSNYNNQNKMEKCPQQYSKYKMSIINSGFNSFSLNSHFNIQTKSIILNAMKIPKNWFLNKSIFNFKVLCMFEVRFI